MTLLSCAVAISTTDSVAEACGGCFHGSASAASVVTGHRMALSISPTRTVLWDQVQYAGDPKDFAWVLPVGAGAYIELADDAWFEALEAVTATRVSSRSIVCGGQELRQGSGRAAGGCGSPSLGAPLSFEDSSSDTHRQGGNPDVTVVHKSTVGPYETVTLKSDDAVAMHDWLTSNGYVIPEDIDGVIADYIAEGADFIAMRLAPNAGVQQMAPVRIITPGASPILPLRMVAAGTGNQTSIVLYVIGEGRYRSKNFLNAQLNPSSLSWDWQSASSNYTSLRTSLLVNNGFLTSFSQPTAFTSPIYTADGPPASYQVGGNLYYNLTNTYFGQAAANQGMGSGCAHVAAALDSSDKVVDTCDENGCADPPKGTIAASSLECDGSTDVAAALIGMHPKDVWVTRLEAELLRSAFAGDLILEAAEPQAAVPNWHIAANSTNLPCDPEPAGSADWDGAGDDSRSGCACITRPAAANTLGAGTVLFGLLLAFRRWRRDRQR